MRHYLFFNDENVVSGGARGLWGGLVRWSCRSWASDLIVTGEWKVERAFMGISCTLPKALGTSVCMMVVALAVADSTSEDRQLPRSVSQHDARIESLDENGMLCWYRAARRNDFADRATRDRPDAATSPTRTLADSADDVASRIMTTPLPDRLEELVIWGEFVEPKRGPIVFLRNGGWLVADLTAIDPRGVSIEHGELGRLFVSYDVIAAVALQWPAARSDRDRLIVEAAEPRGQAGAIEVILDNGDRVRASEIHWQGQSCELREGERIAALSTARIAGIVFPAPAAKPVVGSAPGAWIGLIDGSCLFAERLRIDAGQLHFDWSDRQLEIDADRLAALQPINRRIMYLCDLSPNAYRHLPFLDVPRGFALASASRGGWARCGGRVYRKAIAMHSASRLGFAVDRRAITFVARLGLDDSTGRWGSVTARVFVDGKLAWSSEAIRGGQRPVPVEVALSGAKQLDLVIDYADRADVLDRALWLDPHLILADE